MVGMLSLSELVDNDRNFSNPLSPFHAVEKKFVAHEIGIFLL
jgi:hypothetical protein